MRRTLLLILVALALASAPSSAPAQDAPSFFAWLDCDPVLLACQALPLVVK